MFFFYINIVILDIFKFRYCMEDDIVYLKCFIFNVIFDKYCYFLDNFDIVIIVILYVNNVINDIYFRGYYIYSRYCFIYCFFI